LKGERENLRFPHLKAAADPTSVVLASQDKCGVTFDGAGAVAQLGERYDGIVEVVGSIPSSSTIETRA
jgi:hypothetical protein